MKQSSMGKSRKTAGRKTVRLLMTCIGRRVELLNAFRRAAETLDIDLVVHGVDLNKMSPAINLVDRAHFVDRISSGRYIKQLLGVVRKQKIDLLIPLIDTELALLADAASQFEKVGCLALVSSPGVIETCSDKLATYRALSDAGIDTPVTWTWRESLKLKKHKFPMFLKPRAGSAGMGNYKISTLAELKTFGKRVPDAIVQEFVDGDEYTLDVYTGFDGVPRCAVPRKRLEVRTGEVSKAVIVKDEKIMAIGRRVAEVLGECRGVVTVQMMRNKRGRIRVIEINPRFGGGAPLAIHAGADFPKWVLMSLCGEKPRISKTGFRDDVAMLRYDESVFVSNASR